jgi:glycosyltransferase involved in cell wall biosynthesis
MKICYFGIYNPDFGRNKVYIEALKKAKHTIVECRDDSKGLAKYYSLWKKHKAIDHDYDAIIVGYPGHIMVPLARLISRKIVVADALGSLYDAEVNSHKPTLLRRIEYWLADLLMVKLAHKILLETEAQKKFFEKKYGKSEKYQVVYTGVDEQFVKNFIKSNEQKSKNKRFIVLFRGRLTPECGIMYILKAAEILKHKTNIVFRIIGFGYLLEETEKYILEHNLTNIELVSEYMSQNDLIKQMIGSDLMLGQFDDNPRLNRTIPHKAFEAFAMGIPYLTGNAPAVKEAVIHKKTGFLCNLANSKDLARNIEELSSDLKLLENVAVNAKKQFDSTFSSLCLAEKITKIIVL